MDHEIRGEDRVLKILQSVKTIESWDLAERAGLMDNTCVKYVKYLRDKGHTILSERIEGKAWCKYTYVSGPSMVMSTSSNRLLEQCLDVAKTYQGREDHIEYKKIMLQIEQIEARERLCA